MSTLAGMIGSSLGHYRIDEELGAGGMGVVYRAFDTRLERTVAIKMLDDGGESPHVVRRRLLHEARSTSALNHPNVCTVYEIGEAGDHTYIVMEFIEGQPLRSLVPREGFPAELAMRYGVQITGALAHAHARGIIHRDLKSANVMVTPQGVAKVLDFGLASRAQPRGVDDVTKSHDALLAEGSVAGTLPYMAPEVFHGRPAALATDVWALGVLLYEMATGRMPFTGQTDYVLTAAILHSPPAPMPPGAPAGLYAIVERCLEKEPARRYQSAGEVHAALESALAGRHVEAAQPPAGRRSVLVLPFANLASDTDEYFADGLTDEVITDLSSIHGLRVISRTSSMRLKGTARSVADLARELGVQFVLEGTIRKSGPHLRVTAKLLDPASDSSIWASKYNGTIDDVFAIQESVSRSIVEALQLTLTDDEARQIARRPVGSASAYDSYLRAKQEMLRFSKEGLDRAVEYLSKALATEPDNELLLSAQGHVYWQYVNAGVSADLGHLDRAQAIADRILAANPESAHGHRLAGLVQIHRGDLAQSVKFLKRALDREPNDPDSLFWGGIIASLFGRMDLADAWTSRLVEIDPLTPVYQVLPGVMAVMRGDFEQAVTIFTAVLPSNLDNAPARLFYGQALALVGRTDDAREAWRALERDLPENPFASLGRFYRLALEGNREAALAVMTPELAGVFGIDPQYAWFVADGYAMAGDYDEAIAWVGKAVANGLLNHRLLDAVDPWLEPVRRDPRFEALMRQVLERAKGLEL